MRPATRRANRRRRAPSARGTETCERHEVRVIARRVPARSVRSEDRLALEHENVGDAALSKVIGRRRSGEARPDDDTEAVSPIRRPACGRPVATARARPGAFAGVVPRFLRYTKPTHLDVPTSGGVHVVESAATPAVSRHPRRGGAGCDPTGTSVSREPGTVLHSESCCRRSDQGRRGKPLREPARAPRNICESPRQNLQ